MNGNGKLTYLLHSTRNRRGNYHMGVANLPVTVDLSKVVFFAYPQDDGSLLLSIEKYEGRPERRPKSSASERE